MLYFPACDVNADGSLYLEEENKGTQPFAGVVAVYVRREGERYPFNVVFILTELLNVGS